MPELTPWNGRHEWQSRMVPGKLGPAVYTAMEPAEAAYLAGLAAGLDYLEIGSAAGYSVIAAAVAGAASVTCVDYYRPDDSNENGNGTSHADLLRNLKAYAVESLVTVVVEDSADTLPRLRAEGRRFGVVLVDARHDEQSCARDIEGAVQLLAPGGVLLCHDYDTEHDGVVAALNRIFPGGPARTVCSLWVGESA